MNDAELNRSGITDASSQSESERLGRLYPIILTQHNPLWAQRFKEEKRALEELFGSAALSIEHIGSTAVPGLIAKPTIDILLQVSGNADIESITARMSKAGYIVNRPPNDIIMFLKGYGAHGFEGQAYHIHVRAQGDWGEPYFRDYLIKHPQLAQEYGELKKRLKQLYEFDRDGYTAAKGEFVQRVTRLGRG